MEFAHRPVMLEECLQALAVRPDGLYVDGTAGGAGHSAAIVAGLQTGHLYAFDQDPDAVAVATRRLAGMPATVTEANFSGAAQLLRARGIHRLDGILLDLGVSSHQLDTAERGFSYHGDAPLDMRMAQKGPTAADLVNTLDRQALADILRNYGEEKYAWQIAGRIEAARGQAPIETTAQLAQIITAAMPPAERRKNKNPARKSFQALRIAVNGELDALQTGMEELFSLLGSGGRFCILTFHSLEDRMVKQYFKNLQTACTCPPEFPVCVCGGVARAKAVGRQPQVATEEEQAENRRSRSAKLRVIEKL